MKQFLLDYANLVSVTLIPIIILLLGNHFQNRKMKREAKETLFFKLMAHRKMNPISRDWVDGLNLIDVVFQKDKKVRAAWKEYYNSLLPNSPHNGNSNSFQLDLLSEMANTLNYKNMRQTEIDRFYLPNGLSTPYHDLLLMETLRVLSYSKSYGVCFNEEELRVHLQNLEDTKRELGVY